MPQPYTGTIVSEVSRGTTWRPVIFDVSDYTDLNPDALSISALYFKLQHVRSGYEDPRVLPGGYLPANGDFILRYRRRLRRLRKLPPRHEVYGRFSLQFAEGARRKALEHLNDAGYLRFAGSAAKVRYSRFLREVALSKVVIDLPGNGPFCFRLVDYLAVGACIVGPRHKAEMHVPLRDREHMAWTNEDLSDIVPICESLLSNPTQCERLRRQSAEYFDRYLHPTQLGAYFLDAILSRLR